MWPNMQLFVDLVTFSAEILNENIILFLQRRKT